LPEIIALREAAQQNAVLCELRGVKKMKRFDECRGQTARSAQSPPRGDPQNQGLKADQTSLGPGQKSVGASLSYGREKDVTMDIPDGKNGSSSSNTWWINYYPRVSTTSIHMMPKGWAEELEV